MRNAKIALSSLLAAASIAALGSAMPIPRKGSSRAFRPTPPRLDTEQDREIAAWNAAVDAKKTARKIKHHE
jgi:hypothetical protein